MSNIDTSHRWVVHGTIAEEQELDNSTASSNQEDASYQAIYSTDSREEANEIVKNGGFDLNGRWHVAVWAEDSQSDAVIGAKPQEAAGRRKGGAKRKGDYR